MGNEFLHKKKKQSVFLPASPAEYASITVSSGWWGQSLAETISSGGKALKQPNLATNAAFLALGRMIQSQNMNNLGAEKQLPCSIDKGAKAPTPPGPQWQRWADTVGSQYNLILDVRYCLITRKKEKNHRDLM